MELQIAETSLQGRRRLLTQRDFGPALDDDALQMLFLRRLDVLDAVGLVIRLAMVSVPDQTLVTNRDRTGVAEVLLRGGRESRQKKEEEKKNMIMIIWRLGTGGGDR